ncbi:MAG: SEC-C domain-containing protein [Lachnospiraceae bacterium]|nr:SEC-C domain-containing protein [Lachnospiraceae bacterium]
MSTLLEKWRDEAYSKDMNTREGQLYWGAYFAAEKEVYIKLLSNPTEEVKGTVKELADRYDMSVKYMTGFLDGINESLVTPNPIEEMTEETEVSLVYDKEKLYYNMCEARADWLYNLPEWDALLTEAKRKELFLTQRKSHTVVNTAKIGRNDPCPCGSGKKYKNCCMRKEQQ